MQISVAFPSNLAMFRFCFPLLLSLFLSLLLSSLLQQSTRTGWPIPQVSCEERNEEEDENEEKPQGGLREENEGREAGRIVGGVESISKLQATLFDPLSPPPLLVSRHPPAVFSPASSLRKSHSSCSTHPASLALSRVSLPFGSQHARLEYWYRAKVLFPLNRAATRNNALYVRVLRLSLLAPRFVARLFLSRSDHSNLLRVPPVSILFLSSFRQILSMYSNLSRNTNSVYF